jgi:hypothetical protein
MTGCLEQDYLYVGQDWVRTVPLKVDGLPYNIAGATVTAQLVSVSRTSATTNGAAQSCTDSGGANFAAGVVEVIYVDTVTTALTGGTWALEILVVESGGDKKIFHATTPITVVPTGQG